MPTVVSSIEWLEFDAGALPLVPLNTPAWKVTDYTALRRRVRVGQNRAIPGAPGRLPVAREWDELPVSLPMRIIGTADLEGTPYDDPLLGVDVNHQYLLDNVINVLTERAVTFTRRDGATFTGSLFVEDWQPQVDPNSGGDVLVGSLLLVIPAGWLTETGS